MAEAFSLEKVLMNVSQSLEEELQEVHGHGHGHESHGDGHECHECHGDHGEGHSHGHSHGHQRHDYRVSSVGILRDQEVQKEKLGAESALTGEAGRMRAFGALKQREMQRNSTGFLVLRVVTPLPRAFGSSRGWIASSPGSCRPRVRTCIAPRAYGSLASATSTVGEGRHIACTTCDGSLVSSCRFTAPSNST